MRGLAIAAQNLVADVGVVAYNQTARLAVVIAVIAIQSVVCGAVIVGGGSAVGVDGTHHYGQAVVHAYG